MIQEERQRWTRTCCGTHEGQNHIVSSTTVPQYQNYEESFNIALALEAVSLLQEVGGLTDWLSSQSHTCRSIQSAYFASWVVGIVLQEQEWHIYFSCTTFIVALMTWRTTCHLVKSNKWHAIYCKVLLAIVYRLTIIETHCRHYECNLTSPRTWMEFGWNRSHRVRADII